MASGFSERKTNLGDRVLDNELLHKVWIFLWPLSASQPTCCWEPAPWPLASAPGAGLPSHGAMGPCGNHRRQLRVLPPQSCVDAPHVRRATVRNPLVYTTGGWLKCLNAPRAELLTPQQCGPHVFRHAPLPARSFRRGSQSSVLGIYRSDSWHHVTAAGVGSGVGSEVQPGTVTHPLWAFMSSSARWV